MLIIQDKLVSDELVEEQFICNLSKCKGACCWEGDFGAPLADDELDILNNIYENVRPFLTEEGQNKIDTEGGYEYFKGINYYLTDVVPIWSLNRMVLPNVVLKKHGKRGQRIFKSRFLATFILFVLQDKQVLKL